MRKEPGEKANPASPSTSSPALLSGVQCFLSRQEHSPSPWKPLQHPELPTALLQLLPSVRENLQPHTGLSVRFSSWGSGLACPLCLFLPHHLHVSFSNHVSPFLPFSSLSVFLSACLFTHPSLGLVFFVLISQPPPSTLTLVSSV